MWVTTEEKSEESNEKQPDEGQGWQSVPTQLGQDEGDPAEDGHAEGDGDESALEQREKSALFGGEPQPIPAE